MNVKRYFGRTNKEAMARLRAELGPDAVVLKNRSVDGGVEILAMADDSPPAQETFEHAAPAPVAQRASAPEPAAAQGRARAEAAVPEMSTVSFQQYVRQRLAQKEAAAPTLDEVLAPAAVIAAERIPVESATIADEPASARMHAQAAPPVAARSAAPGGRAPAFAPGNAASADARAPFDAGFELPLRGAPAASDAMQAQNQAKLLGELREMRSFIADQLNSLAWFDGTRRNPIQAKLMRELLSAGFSPALTRTVIARMPSDYDEAQSCEWVKLALAKNLLCSPGASLIDQGGIFALVGPTGVGKTTSTAKIAARFALKHGTQSVGLISVDAYRIGGQDQLRSFGRLLGVPVHVAHDAATLADFLHLYMNKKLVLIDTAGIGQRDERVDELLASLSSSVVRKLVVLNAAVQAETLEDVIAAYRAPQAAGVVISKVDEAVKLGGVLDCAVRHRLKIVGVANGQRVPEDWVAPNAERLVESALAGRPASAFDLEEREMGMMFLPEGRTPGFDDAGVAHA